MKSAKVLVDGTLAGYLIEIERGVQYEFNYLENYSGPPISLTMPTSNRSYIFDRFPPFFEGFLPEGVMLRALLQKTKTEADDFFEQLMWVGSELVGNVQIIRAT